MRDKFWDIAGTKMGDLLKVKKEESKNSEPRAEKVDEVDYKASNKYASTLK